MSMVPATISERVPMPSPAMPGPAVSAGLAPADFMRMIRSRLVLIIVLFMFLSVVAVGLFLLWYVKFPTYSATAIIECISSAPKAQYSVELQRYQQDEHERFLLSQALYVKQPSILMEVLRSPEVRATDWYASVEEDERLLELEDTLSCSPIRDSNYIRVAMGTRSPKDPHVIVEKAVEIYLREAKDRAAAQFRVELTKLEEEASSLWEQIQSQMKQIGDFAATLPEGVLGQERRSGMTVVEAELLAAQQQVTEYRLQTLELEGIKTIYENPQMGITPEDRQLVELNPMVQMLLSQVLALDQELKAKRRKFGENHREVRNLRSRLAENEEQLRQMREQKLQESIELKQEQVRTAFLNSQHAELLAGDRLTQIKAKQKDVERKLQDYQRLKDELEFLKEAREKANEYIREVRRIVAERSAIRIELLQPALQPIERSQPKWYFGAVGVFLALAMSVGLAILLELMDTSVRTARDVARYLNVPILGTVPDADDEEVEVERIEAAVREVPHSMLAEAFRAVRTALQFSAPAERERTIVVTSPRPDDGKTTVACNLATSLALSGRRVLLVDANFRRPAIHRVFALENQEGLSNILIGAGRLSDLVSKTDLGNLDVLVSGPAPPNPAEGLGSPLMRRLLEEATGVYDHVIIDSPPTLLASDAPVLTTIVDGTIIVLRAKENSRGVAQRAVSVLNHVNAHVFGVVLNAAQAQRGGYFREQLRTFYDYQAEGALEGGPGGAALPSSTRADAIGGEVGGGPAGDDGDRR